MPARKRLLDLTRQSLFRFTFSQHESNPVWSPNGSRIIYTSNLTNIFNGLRKSE